jgi:hypothetical protein
VTRGFMGPLGGFWPKLGRKRVTGWKQRSCVPPGRVKTNKQTNIFSGCVIGTPVNFGGMTGKALAVILKLNF